MCRKYRKHNFKNLIQDAFLLDYSESNLRDVTHFGRPCHIKTLKYSNIQIEYLSEILNSRQNSNYMMHMKLVRIKNC